ncbi:hypothetical protein PoB_001645600 [Plakobranchus ocellatus]|uniref:Uncharacterized protein n=1 Tax=Plakobranchus ocellatus TaxID=259542 RepID=A0AAV3Z5T3_9GAST|nr:hypothetical protein PoB_001645600 [Plakobranchus ocellatus]
MSLKKTGEYMMILSIAQDILVSSPVFISKPPLSPQQDDLKLSGTSSGQGADSEARTRDRGFLHIPRQIRYPLRHQSLLADRKEIDEGTVDSPSPV